MVVYKVVVLGDSGVGKTNIHTRLVSGVFSDYSRPTMGLDFSVKRFECGQRLVTLQLWDTAGQERFRSLAINTYLKRADGVVVVYDVSQRRSFNNVLSWKHEVDACPLVPSGIPAILVGNKSDLGDTRKVSFEEGLKLADSQSMMFTECSAKEGGRRVDLIFTLLVGEIQRLQMNSPEVFDTPPIDVSPKKCMKKKSRSSSTCTSSSDLWSRLLSGSSSQSLSSEDTAGISLYRTATLAKAEHDCC